jgi:hypothetical protein
MSKSKNKSNNRNLAFSKPSSFKGDVGFSYGQKEISSKTALRLSFSFRHVCTKAFCVKKCCYEQIKAYSDKLRQLSELEWDVIESSPRETNGYEKINTSQIKASLPQAFRNKSEVMVFRFGGGGGVGSKTSGRIVGIKEKECFFVLFVDRDFTLYDHGS